MWAMEQQHGQELRACEKCSFGPQARPTDSHSWTSAKWVMCVRYLPQVQKLSNRDKYYFGGGPRWQHSRTLSLTPPRIHQIYTYREMPTERHWGPNSFCIANQRARPHGEGWGTMSILQERRELSRTNSPGPEEPVSTIVYIAPAPG